MGSVILRVGLTGNIGAGKSTVTGLLDGPDFLIINADLLGHEVLASDEDALQRIVAALGTDVLDAAGRLDRAAIARQVFADEEARRRLEEIVHPLIRAREEARVDSWGVVSGIAVTEAALLVETGGHARYDSLVVVTAPEEARVARLVARGVTEEEARARIAAQLPEADKVAVADYVIDNSGSLDDTRAQTAQLRVSLLDDLRALRDAATSARR
jgi:dephospho-CoA kinase